MRFRYIVFDFDGVLADTADINFSVSKNLHPEITRDDFIAHHDGNVYESPRIPFTPETTIRYYRDYQAALSESHLARAAGPVRTLAADYALYIISSTSEAAIHAVLKSARLDDAFVRVLDGLVERDFGVMTGVQIGEIKARCAPDVIETETVTYFLSPEGAETFPTLVQRAQSVLAEVSKQHAHGQALLVTHGDIGKMLYAAYYQMPWEDVPRHFHFGNTDVLLLSEDSPASEAHVFKVAQHNH